jgi:enoyl-CoA hydratase
MAEPVLRIEEDDGVVTLTLNRPHAMNALSRALRAALVDAFAAVATNSRAEVVILTGSGRAFCAGLDLKELGSEGLGTGAPDVEAGAGATESAVTSADIIRAMAACERPIIGAVNGVAVTGGFELALACDVLIASTEARFADTQARVGILPGWGLSQKLSRMIGIMRAKELSLTGNYLSAQQAETWGLVNHVVAPADLLPTCRRLAADMRSCVPEVMRAYKRLIDDGFAATFGDGLRLETARSREHARTVGADAIAARRAQIQARGREQAK